jgi:hypothetical protein
MDRRQQEKKIEDDDENISISSAYAPTRTSDTSLTYKLPTMQQTPQPDLPLPLLDHLVRMFGRWQGLQPEPEGVFEGGQGFLHVVRMSLGDRN